MTKELSDNIKNKIAETNDSEEETQENRIKCNEHNIDSVYPETHHNYNNLLIQDFFLSEKPKQSLIEGKAHSERDIYERGVSLRKFSTRKINRDALKKCYEAIEKQKRLLNPIHQNKFEIFLNKLKVKGEIQIPEMKYLKRVRIRVKNILVEKSSPKNHL